LRVLRVLERPDWVLMGLSAFVYAGFWVKLPEVDLIVFAAGHEAGVILKPGEALD